MTNPYDNVDAIRKILPVMDAEQEMNYIGYLSDEIEDKTLFLDLRIRIHQLNERVRESEARIKEQDRCIRCVIWGTVFAFAMLVFTVRMFWM